MSRDDSSFRCILNDDGIGIQHVPPPHDASQVDGPIATLRGTPVDCFCWFIADEVAYYKSDVLQTLYDLYGHREYRYTDTKGAVNDLPYALYQRGIDYIPLMIDHAHDAAIAFFASFRMNDTHLKSDPQGMFAPDFWQQHPEYRLWGNTYNLSYYNAAMDYSFEEVRNRKLDAMEEVARKYAVDGIELDMGRNPYFFQPDEAWEKRDILTQFLVELRKRLDAVGRPVQIMIRTLFAEDRLRFGGMDLRTWIEQGLMDYLCLTDLVNTFRADLAPWASLCQAHGIPMYPTLDGGTPYIDRRNFFDIFTNPNAPPHNYGAPVDYTLTLRAAAQNFLSQEHVAGIYFFNHPPRPFYSEPPEFLTGAFDTLHRDKRYHFWKGLPLYVEAQRPARYHQTITFPVCGEDIGDPSSEVVLSFRQQAIAFPHAPRPYEQSSIVPPGLLKYTLNGEEIDESAITRHEQPAGRIHSGHTLRTHEKIEIRLPGTALCNGTNTLAFSMPKQAEIHDPYVYIFELDVEIRFRQ